MTDVTGPDRVALVTGASSGIGAATMRAMVAAGIAVCGLARRRDRLDQLTDELGADAFGVVCDVTDPQAIEHATAATLERFGRLDIVVNNAGLMLTGPFSTAPDHEADDMVAVNLLAPIRMLASTIAPLLRAAEECGVADVVMVGSVAGLRSQPNAAVYCATKAGLAAFADGVRQELAGTGVRVTTVSPGFTSTELTSHIRSEVLDPMRAALDAMPAMSADDVARSICFAVGQPAEVALSEIVVRPSAQAR